MLRRIINIIILLSGISGIFWWSYNSFKDLSVSIILVMSSLTILIRLLKWPYDDWLFIRHLSESTATYKQKDVQVVGTSVSDNLFTTKIEDLSKPKEVDTYFKHKVSEKETRDFVVDLNSSLLASLLISLLTGAAAIIIGHINIKNTQNIDPSKLMYSFIPITWQLSTLIIPFLHFKKRNEKALIL